jgi:hypothetical protein
MTEHHGPIKYHHVDIDRYSYRHAVVRAVPTAPAPTWLVPLEAARASNSRRAPQSVPIAGWAVMTAIGTSLMMPNLSRCVHFHFISSEKYQHEILNRENVTFVIRKTFMQKKTPLHSIFFYVNIQS